MTRIIAVLLVSITLVLLIKININGLISENGEKTETSHSVEMTSGINDEFGEISDAIEGLWGYLPEGTDEGEIPDFDVILGSVIGGISDKRSALATFLLTLVGTALLLSLAERGVFDRGLEATASAALSGVMSIPIFTALYPLVKECGACIETGCGIFGALIPVAVSVTAFGGGASASVVQGAGMSLALGFVSEVIKTALLPTVSVMLALALSVGFDKEGVTGALCTLIKNLLVGILSFIGMVLPATLAMQNFISSAKDTVALRTARYAAGNMIPLVGSTVSGALSTLGAGAGIMRGTVGAVGSCALMFVFLAPTAILLLYRLCMRIALTLLDFIGTQGAKRMLSSMTGALDALIAMVVISGAVFFLEIIIFMRTAVSV